MPRSSCEPCCNPTELARLESSFRDAALQILCAIEANTSGGGAVSENVNVAQWGGTATTLGQKAMAASVPVVIASDQSTLGVTPNTAAQWGLFAEDSASASGDIGNLQLHVSNETLTNLVADGDYVVPASTRKGVGLTTLFADANLSGISGTAVREEDSAFPASGGLVMAGAVNNRSGVAFNSTQGDVTPHGVNDFGGQLIEYRCDLLTNSNLNPGRLEDAAFGAGDAVMMAGGVNNRSLTAFNATNGDVTPMAVDDHGRTLTAPYTDVSRYVYGNISVTAATNTSLIAAAGASTRNYVTNLSISNTGATTSLITITDGSGGATLWQSIAPAGSGSNITFTIPIRTSANTALFVTTGSASTTMYVSAAGFTGP